MLWGSNLGERQPGVISLRVFGETQARNLTAKCSLWSSELGHRCMNLPCSIVESQGSPTGRKWSGLLFARRKVPLVIIASFPSPPLSGHPSINTMQGTFWKIMVLASSIDTVAVATSHIPGPLFSHLETARFQVLEIVITSSFLLRRFTLELRFEDFPDLVFCIQNKP